MHGANDKDSVESFTKDNITFFHRFCILQVFRQILENGYHLLLTNMSVIFSFCWGHCRRKSWNFITPNLSVWGANYSRCNYVERPVIVDYTVKASLVFHLFWPHESDKLYVCLFRLVRLYEEYLSLGHQCWCYQPRSQRLLSWQLKSF